MSALCGTGRGGNAAGMATFETELRAARALDALYREHAPEVYRYAYAVLGNRADAEDVMQTVFVNALRAMEHGERPRKPSNWLITIAHNVVRQRFRQEQTRPAEVELDAELEAPGATPGGEGSIEDLVRALQRIPSSQREALVMRELEGRSYTEIREVLGVSGRALETLLFRARRSLAEELENLVTCDRAELAISKHADARLSRKELRRLKAHVRECPSCARVAATQARRRRAFKNLSLLPLPLPLVLFRGAPDASAAAGISTIGTAATVSGAATVGSAGGTAGGLITGGVAAKLAAAVTAVAVAGGAGYEGAKQLRQAPPRANAPARLSSQQPARPTAPSTAAIHRVKREEARGAPRRPSAHAGRPLSKVPHLASRPGASATRRTTAQAASASPAAAPTSPPPAKAGKAGPPDHARAKPKHAPKPNKPTTPKAHLTGKTKAKHLERAGAGARPDRQPPPRKADKAEAEPSGGGKAKPEPEPRRAKD